jgi:hypothetical protein
VHTLALPDKVYTMDASDDRVVIGMNNRQPPTTPAFCAAESSCLRVCLPPHLTSDLLRIIAPARHVFIVDVRNLTQPEEQRESTLKNQTRCVRCYPEGHGFALSSIEGRVAMEFFDSAPDVQAKKCGPSSHFCAAALSSL